VRFCNAHLKKAKVRIIKHPHNTFPFLPGFTIIFNIKELPATIIRKRSFFNKISRVLPSEKEG